MKYLNYTLSNVYLTNFIFESCENINSLNFIDFRCNQTLSIPMKTLNTSDSYYNEFEKLLSVYRLLSLFPPVN